MGSTGDPGRMAGQLQFPQFMNTMGMGGGGAVGNGGMPDMMQMMMCGGAGGMGCGIGGGLLGGGMFNQTQLQQFAEMMAVSGNGSAMGSMGATMPAIADAE